MPVITAILLVIGLWVIGYASATPPDIPLGALNQFATQCNTDVSKVVIQNFSLVSSRDSQYKIYVLCPNGNKISGVIKYEQ